MAIINNQLKSRFNCGVIKESKKQKLKWAAICSLEKLSEQLISLSNLVKFYSKEFEKIIKKTEHLKEFQSQFYSEPESIRSAMFRAADRLNKKYQQNLKLYSILIEDLWIKVMYIEDILIIKKKKGN